MNSALRVLSPFALRSDLRPHLTRPLDDSWIRDPGLISVGLSLAFGALALALIVATARTEIRVIVRARRLGLASSPKPRRPLRDRPRPSPSRRPGLRSVQACST